MGLWSTFSYISGNSKSVLYVPASDIENLPAAGMTNKLKLAMAANRRGGMLTRLNGLRKDTCYSNRCFTGISLPNWWSRNSTIPIPER
ncbi:hypothetical protein WJ970_25210 [Achromobacter xylosoxidans]